MDYLGENVRVTIKHDLAYTEDDIPIKRLFIHKISASTKDQDVLNYFAKFGEVEKIRIYPDKRIYRRFGQRVGYVQYADERIAKKVLFKERHMLRSRLLLVSACHSWHQPGAYAPKNVAAEPHADADADVDMDVTPTAPPQLNLLDLNDDCLEHVIKYLGPVDQVRVARTCTRLYDVVKMCSKVQHKIVWLDKLRYMTVWETFIFFSITGSVVETIIGELLPKSVEHMVALISRYCKKVRRIYLDSSQVPSLRQLVGNMPHLSELHLHDCNLTDNDMLGIQHLTNMQELTLSGNHSLSGKYLSKHSNVRILDLSGCCHLETEHLIDMVQSMPNLKLLNIQNCLRLTTSVFEAMETHCQRLQTLQMSSIDIDYPIIARLPALKRLDIYSGNFNVHASLFPALAAHLAHQLEHLNISSRNCIDTESAVYIAQLKKLKHLNLSHNVNLNDNCLLRLCELEQLDEIGLRNSVSITNDGLLNLMRRCTNLKAVNIQRCSQINDDFIFEVIEMLRRREQNRLLEPIVFYVLKTQINEFVMNDPRCQEADSLIVPSFYCPTSMYYMAEDEFMDEFSDSEYDEDELYEYYTDSDDDGDQIMDDVFVAE